jgi:hypothetical protein
MGKRASTRMMYMHTIDGRPAFYEGADGQVVFAPVGRYARAGAVLVPNLQQVRQEQRASTKWRIAHGFNIDGFDYGYVRVEVPR